MINELKRSLECLREQRPLVLCLSNVVVMDFMANSLNALGASPIMSQSEEELADLMALAQSVSINLGTLDVAFIQRAEVAVRLAKQRGIPIVLDPVGAGASKLRTQTAQHLATDAGVIRGNASEILALANLGQGTHGVDSIHTVLEAEKAAQKISEGQRVVMVSGPIDYLTDGVEAEKITFGSPLMPLVTGMGCVLTSVIAAFSAVSISLYEASLQAGRYFALCGQVTAQQTQVPGSFRQYFIDQLYQPDWERMQSIIAGNKS